MIYLWLPGTFAGCCSSCVCLQKRPSIYCCFFWRIYLTLFHVSFNRVWCYFPLVFGEISNYCPMCVCVSLCVLAAVCRTFYPFILPLPLRSWGSLSASGRGGLEPYRQDGRSRVRACACTHMHVHGRHLHMYAHPRPRPSHNFRNRRPSCRTCPLFVPRGSERHRRLD